jgi:hypothetical protein
MGGVEVAAVGWAMELDTAGREDSQGAHRGRLQHLQDLGVRGLVGHLPGPELLRESSQLVAREEAARRGVVGALVAGTVGWGEKAETAAGRVVI